MEHAPNDSLLHPKAFMDAHFLFESWRHRAATNSKMENGKHTAEFYGCIIVIQVCLVSS